MDETSPPPTTPSPEPTPPAHGGIEIQGGSVSAARDIVAGDVNVAGNSISGQTVIVQQGFSYQQVQRLILLVVGIVFVTAAIFFVIGAITVGPVVAALNRPVPGGSSPEKGLQMAQDLSQIKSLPPGTPFRASFTEDEVSSYFRFIVGPAIDVSDGKARFLDEPGDIALGGDLDNRGGLPMTAQISVTTGDQPVVLEGLWVKVLPTPEGVAFGWIPVAFLAQDFTQRLNQVLFQDVTLTSVNQSGNMAPGAANSLIVTGVVQ